MGAKIKKRSLRIGVIQSGRLIEEFIVRDNKPVTVGTNIKNSVVVADRNLPSRYKLFVYKNGSYSIELMPSMVAEIKEGTKVDKYKNRKKTIKLTQNFKGKVTINKTTILFQFIEAPEQYFAPKKIPAQFRNKISDYIDWKFMFPLLFSLLANLGWAVGLQLMEFEPTMISMDSLPDRFREVVIEKPKKEETVEVENKDGDKDGDAKEKKDEKKVVKKEKTSAKKEKASTKAERKAIAKKSLAKKSKLISSLRKIKSGGNGGGFGGIISGGTGGDGDSPKSLSALGLENNGGGGNGSGYGSGSGDGIGFRGMGANGGGGTGISRKTNVGTGPSNVKTSDIGTERKKLTTKKVKKVSIKPRTKTQSVKMDKGINQSSAKRALRKANRKMTGCYQTQAKKNNSFAGKIKIMITIGADGKPIDVAILETRMNDGTLAKSMISCIKRKLKRVRFPKPEKPPVSVKFTAAFSPGG